MMEERITFMSYNGLRKKKLDELPKNFFDDALIVVDEIHNVIRSVINGSNIMN
jgi:superfamily II DNA or RNA helicase